MMQVDAAQQRRVALVNVTCSGAELKEKCNETFPCYEL